MSNTLTIRLQTDNLDISDPARKNNFETLNLDLDLDYRHFFNDESLREWYYRVFFYFDSLNTNKNNVINLGETNFNLILQYLDHDIQSTNLNKNEIILSQEPFLAGIPRFLNRISYSGKFINYEFTNIRKKIRANATFFSSNTIASDLPISTPLTFPYSEDKLYLTLDKSGWWNPLGGHIESGETWQDALKREAQEEGGIKISNIQVFGYIRIVRLPGENPDYYPEITQIPMTTSSIISLNTNWEPMETTANSYFSPQTAYEFLSKRNDDHQMLQIYSYLMFLKKHHLLNGS